MIKTSFWIISIFLLCISCSPEEDCEEKAFWEDCLIEEPTLGRLNVRVTTNAANPEVKIHIYAGDDFETGVLVIKDVLNENVSYHLPFGDYSGTAVYYVGSDSLLAVDGDDISKSLEEYCDIDCWEISEGNLDLTL